VTGAEEQKRRARRKFTRSSTARPSAWCGKEGLTAAQVARANACHACCTAG
jgi:hypothetical protein